MLQPANLAELQQMVRETTSLRPTGGGSKPALSRPDMGQTALSMSHFRGVLEYQPSEFVFVARPGTPLLEIEQMLAQHGQYLPFDPPLVAEGATLGGTVAAGLSGSMRQRYGGVRDFVLGLEWVNGLGQTLRGGGKVVKNAAGFDLPKLAVGSMGRLGVFTELALKVFPAPPATLTLRFNTPTLAASLQLLARLANSRFEFYALDLEPPHHLVVRLGGLASTLAQRQQQLEAFVGQGGEAVNNEGTYWQAQRSFDWSQGFPLVKIPLTTAQIPALETHLSHQPRRYLAAGNLLYLAWPGPLEQLDALLHPLLLSGILLRGEAPVPWLGRSLHHIFAQKMGHVLDPHRRFGGLPWA
jgi:glycolate oxidase FAD binding subunit